jgi:hypothetical protein
MTNKAAALDFTPFADESAVREIGGLTIENRVDRVSLFGSVDITLDKAGDARLRELEALVAGLRAAFDRQAVLPDRLPEPTLGSMDNPEPAGKL